ncbi:hypothetical protein [Roseibium sp. MMSF_3412]|uniref:hypothetical protein n=1 Tax=Roseibium sp. MMSF_3412 TaxID=3046712 RepID=UPI00273DE153|nr:hypothetical protein [Roseibium sp. MMSF_3412]
MPVPYSRGVIAMQILSLRFVEVRNPEGGAYKRYHVLADENECVRFDLTKRTIGKPVDMVNLLDQSVRTLTPERKLLCRQWHLAGGDPAEEGQIAAKGSDTWLVHGPSQTELFRVVDPRRLATKTLETMLGSWPDSYAVVSGDQCVGVIRRALKPGQEEPTNRLGKLAGLFKDRDWALVLSQPIPLQAAYRMIASVLLLIEVTVSGARAG